MTAMSVRRVILLVPLLALSACARAAAGPRAADVSPSDGPQTYQEATGPESTLRRVFVAAGIVYKDNGKTYAGATPQMFADVIPDTCFVSDPDKAVACDAGGATAFVIWHDQSFGAATSDGSGGCSYVRNDGGDQIAYGSGSECTGAAALDATSPQQQSG